MENNLEAQKVISFEERAARARDRANLELHSKNLQAEVLPGALIEGGFREADTQPKPANKARFFELRAERLAA